MRSSSAFSFSAQPSEKRITHRCVRPATIGCRFAQTETREKCARKRAIRTLVVRHLGRLSLNAGLTIRASRSPCQEESFDATTRNIIAFMQLCDGIANSHGSAMRHLVRSRDSPLMWNRVPDAARRRPPLSRHPVAPLLCDSDATPPRYLPTSWTGAVLDRYGESNACAL